MIAMTLGLSLEQKLELESPHKTAMKLYAASEKASVEVCLGNRRMSVPFALVSEEDLEPIFPGERHAATIGGMFFITKETPESYRHFAAFHELAEHAAPRGFDVTGLAKHLQAVAVELGYAQATLAKQEYENYFEWRKSVEKSNFFKLKDEGLITRITGKIDAIFRSMPQFLRQGRRKLVELIQDQRKQVEENKMSLGEKLAKHNQEHQEALARCEEEHHNNQTLSVIANFDKSCRLLAEKTKPAGNALELKSALDQLQGTYDSGNDLVKSTLEATIGRMRREYEKNLASEAKAQAPLCIELLWNSNNGDKELIIPIKWESRLNKNSATVHSIAEKLYEAAVKAVLDNDLEAAEEEWHGYTRIVSKNVAGKASEGFSPKNSVIQLQADAINEYIINSIGQELKSYNIELSTVNSKIKMLHGQGYKHPKKAPEQKAEPALEEITAKSIENICACISVDDVAAELGLDRNSVLYKINVKKQLHGISVGVKKKYMVPLHDLITYTYNHPKTGFDGARANKFVKELQELTAEEFAKYKSEVDTVHSINETSDMLGIARSTVNLWLGNGKMHGVMHKGAWYIPKTEIELCRELYLAKK